MGNGLDIQKAKNIKALELMERLSASPGGLSSEEARKRYEEYGYNEEKVNPIKKFFNFFWGPIPWMIEIALLISILIQHWEEFAIILILLLINGGVGFYQEYKADNAIDLLKEKLSYHVHAMIIFLLVSQ